MSRVSQEELYNDKDVITQILKLKDTVNDYAGGIIENISISGNNLVIDWASGESVSLPLPSPTGIGSVTGAVSGGNLTITFYMTDGSSHAFTCPLTGMATEAYVDAKDVLNVKLTGAQSVAGVKTFSDSPLVPVTPSSPPAAVCDVYVNNAAEGVNNIVHKSGNETMSGNKTFLSEVFLKRTSLHYGRTDNPPTTDVPGLSTFETFTDDHDVWVGTIRFRLNNDGTTQFEAVVRNSDGTFKYQPLVKGDVI